MKTFMHRLLLTIFILPLNCAFALDVGESVLYVRTNDNYLVVDLTGHEAFSKLNSNLLEKVKPGPLSEWTTVPIEMLPTPLQIKTLEILTPGKRLQAKIIEAKVKYGASNASLILVSDQKSSYGEIWSGIAKLGAPFPATANLKLVTDEKSDLVNGIEGTSPLVSEISGKFKAWIDSEIDRKSLELYNRLKISNADFRFLKGNFRPGGEWLAWGHLSYSQEREKEDLSSFMAAAILNTEGKIIETLQKPSVGMGDSLGSWVPKFHVDIDADGIEEIICGISHYEGGENVLLKWKDGKVSSIILEGDSA